MELSAFKWLALTTLFAMAMTGGLVPLRFRNSKSVARLLSLGNMFAGGIFLGGGLLHLLPEANENYEHAMSATEPNPQWPELMRTFPVAFWLSGIGFFAVLVVEESALAWTAAKQRKLARDHKRGLVHPPLTAGAAGTSGSTAASVSAATAKALDADRRRVSSVARVTIGDGSAPSALGMPLLSAVAHDSADDSAALSVAGSATSDTAARTGSTSVSICRHARGHGSAAGAVCELTECTVVQCDGSGDDETDDADASDSAQTPSHAERADVTDGKTASGSGRSALKRMSSHLQAEADRELAARVITSLAPRATLRGTDSPPATPRRHHHHHRPARHVATAYGAMATSAARLGISLTMGTSAATDTDTTFAVTIGSHASATVQPGNVQGNGHSHGEGHGQAHEHLHGHSHGEAHGHAHDTPGDSSISVAVAVKSDGNTAAHAADAEEEHGHGHGGDHDHMALDPALASGVVAYVLVLALSFHSVFEGVAFGTQTNMSSAVALYVAIAAHTPLAGFALGVSLVKAQAPTRTLVACISLFSATVPVGTLLGVLFNAVLSGVKLELVSACTQAFASGTFLFVALGEIIPKELAGPRDKGLKVLLCLTGFIGMALIKLFDD